MKIIGIGGSDFTKGKEKDMLSAIWQIVRLNSLKKVGSEEKLIEWVNNSMKDKSKCIKKFNDSKAFEDGKFVINIIDSFDDSIIDWKLIREGEGADVKKANDLYGITSARKLGAYINYVPTDNGVQNAKQMLLIASGLNNLESVIIDQKEVRQQ